MELYTWHSPTGFRVCLTISKGRKWLRTIPLDGMVRVRKLKLTEMRNMKPLLYKGKPYPLTRAFKHYRKQAKIFGTTKAATDALRGANV